jgi:hypothetical protein
MEITTPARVRNRIQATEVDISDDVLNELIADEQAFVEAYVEKTFAESDPQQSGLADCGDHRSVELVNPFSALQRSSRR